MPLARYEAELAAGDLSHDPAQAQAARLLDELAHRLAAADRRPRGLLDRLRRRPVEPETGLYLWGDTGRGKTWLMDLFFQGLPFPEKKRQHFHRFMAHVHDELAGLQRVEDPLQEVANRLANRARVVCFDEFYVSDIADAMILGGLLTAMFERGVTLVATSNIPPDGLYAEGLQRARFLPAIHQIQRHTLVHEMNGPVDYRLRSLEQAAVYYHPADPGADRALADCFARLSPQACLRDEPLEVLGRVIPTRRRADGVAWFDFTAICEGPRSQADYIEIARAFHSVLVSSVPRLDDALANATRRFIALVDEFYDRNDKLILSAATPLAQLYAGRRLAFEFRRTRSRLEEMQSHDYLARPHLP